MLKISSVTFRGNAHVLGEGQACQTLYDSSGAVCLVIVVLESTRTLYVRSKSLCSHGVVLD